ncbi:hypothetical protein VNI00_004256 [Paramarasmius palmivorus]|uniref:Aminoglycoside phosphotransferase domain-containing protein n=1 Tax=Paramarasmius palmivorus TaxID=297713 RepID=A0AAW0DQ20_9AGAR
MTPSETIALEVIVVDACAQHEQAHWKDPNYRACVFIGTDYFVKFGDPKTLGPEIATQLHIFEYANSHPDIPNTPRIPQVIHHFQNQWTMYLVMEYIALTADPPDLDGRAAEALKWLSGVPPPPGHVIGPLGGGRIRHRFFKDDRAPLLFSSTEALERYMQKGYSLLSTQTKQQLSPINICGEHLMFIQPDMDSSNFGVDEHGKTVLMDFGEVALLPESFAAHAMTSDMDKNLTQAITKSLGLSSSSNAAKSMAAISWRLWITADPKLGLNEHGYPKTRDRP